MNINAYEPEIKPILIMLRKAQYMYEKLNRLEEQKQQIARRRENVYNRKRTYKSKKGISTGLTMADVTGRPGAGDARAVNQANIAEPKAGPRAEGL